MSVVKIFYNGAWRELLTPGTIIPTSTPQFPDDVLEYSFITGQTADFTLPEAVRSGTTTVTYTFSGLPAGFTATGRRVQGSSSTAFTRTTVTLTATYSDGATVSREFTITVTPAPVPVPSGVPQNVRVSAKVFNESNDLTSLTIAWDAPTPLLSTVQGWRPWISHPEIHYGGVSDVLPLASRSYTYPSVSLQTYERVQTGIDQYVTRPTGRYALSRGDRIGVYVQGTTLTETELGRSDTLNHVL